MAKIDNKLNINLLHYDVIKELIQLLNENIDALPRDLVNQLGKINSIRPTFFTVADLDKYVRTNNISYNDIEVSHENVTKACKDLKVITIKEKGEYEIGMKEIEVDFFYVKHGDKLIYGW